MENGEHLSLEQIRTFLIGNEEIEFKAQNRKELYEWTQQALCAQSYSSLHRSGKGLMKRYVGKVTGLSRAQVTRLIRQYCESGIVRSRQGRGQRFTARYSPGGIALLAEASQQPEAEGSYDCVDRVVLNAYFGMGQTGGGLHVWWRGLHGSDANLDDNHLMRMAGRFSRRLRAWAKENRIPVVYCPPGEDKHKMAEQHLATRETKPGLFMILLSKAPALVWEAQMTGTGKLGQLVPKRRWPYVNHYSFHILDPDWGHLTIKMSGHPPFGAQVMLNGHEYVACQAQRAAVGFTKQDNCFTTITSAAELAQVADTLSQNETAGRLRQLCERWIYTTCLCFALDLEEQERSLPLDRPGAELLGNGGNPEMSKYRQWTSDLIEMLRDQFDEQRILERSRDDKAHPRILPDPQRPHVPPVSKYSEVVTVQPPGAKQ